MMRKKSAAAGVAMSAALIGLTGALMVGTSMARPAARVASDAEIRQRCPTTILDDSLRERIDLAKQKKLLPPGVETLIVNCANMRVDGEAGVSLPIKAVPKIDAKAKLTLDTCLKSETNSDPKIVELATRIIFDPSKPDADKPVRDEVARCRVNMIRCGQHPCPRRDTVTAATFDGTSTACVVAFDFSRVPSEERQDLLSDPKRYKRAGSACSAARPQGPSRSWKAQLDGIEIPCKCSN